MAINTQSLFDRVKAKLGGTGTSATLPLNFINALRYALQDMNNDCLLSATAPSDLATDINLDGKYEPCVEAGVCYYLGDYGYKDEDWTAKYFRIFKDQRRTAQMQNQLDEGMEGKFGDLSD